MARQNNQVFLLTLLVLLSIHSSAQIIIQSGPDITPVDMVEFLLDDGMSYDNVTFQGADISRGIFMDGDTTILGFGTGLFLCSGSGNNIPGPNNSSSAGTNNGTPGSATLNSLTTSTTYDAAVLEFDLLADFDTLAFRYIFGSEEYNEWVGSSFHDVFGLFITGPDPNGGYYVDKNIAIVPETVNTYVAINNVNNGYASGGVVPTGPCTNCDYYVDNTGGTTLQYDGFTTALTAWIPVVPCEEYHLKIGVADAGDGIYDSGIFLEMKSLQKQKITPVVSLTPPGLEETLYEGVVGANIAFRLPEGAETPYTLFLEVGGTANPAAYPEGDFLEEIPSTVYFGEGIDTASIQIFPVYDEMIEGIDNLVFLLRDSIGCPVYYNIPDTLELLIEDYFSMDLTTSPNMIICEGMIVDLWTAVEYGYPPYTFSWEPGGYTSDTITVSPDTTTVYYVTCQDFAGEVVTGAVVVTVFPNDGAFNAFSFEKALNPQLPIDITGELFEDSVSVIVPEGTDLNNLIATFTLSGTTWFAQIGTQPQFSGVTPNDFTEPVVYGLISAAGCARDWTVTVTIATSATERWEEKITVAPNPVKDHLVITHATGSEVQLLNTMGTKVLQTYITRSPFELDLQHLQNGIYLLRIDQNNKETTRKIILAR